MTDRHVVMAVASGIARDARVRKSALAVAATGARVTLVWGDHEGTEVVEGELGPVRTLGLPVPYVLRDARTRRRAAHRAWRPAWPGYRNAAAQRAAAAALDARSARVDGRGPAARLALRADAAAHRARVDLARFQDRAFASLWRRYDARRRAAAVAHPRWRKDLPNIADLEAAFTARLALLEPDVLHIHDIHLLGAGVQAKRRLAARGRNVPLIYDAHEYVPGMTGGDPAAEAAYQAMEAELIGDADRVITVSEPIADALVERYGLARRPTVVLNTPSHAPSHSERNLRAELELSADVPLLVYSGVLGRLRNVPTIIRALAAVEGAHLAIVCVPNAHYPVALALLETASQAGVADRVHLVEPVEPEQIIGFLSSADLGVHAMSAGLPNHEMALPNKLFDYVYAGLPVAVSDVVEMRRFVTEFGIGTVFDPADSDACARAVSAALADLDTLREAVRSDQLRQTYAWESQAAHLAELYGTL